MPAQFNPVTDKISEIVAIEILDSRGNPTVGVRVETEGGALGEACVPSGASTGAREAKEVRDQDPDRFLGRGVRSATGAVNAQLREALLGMPVDGQADIDRAMLDLDGTPDKGRLGANALLGVSLACARAAAAAARKPLFEHLRTLAGGGARPMATPLPMANILNGGLHADNPLDIQECMVMPIAAERCSTAVRQCAEVFQHLKKVLAGKGLSTLVGDEGGFAPSIGGVEEALGFLLDSVRAAGLEPGRDVALALDCASTEFYRDGRYRLPGAGLDLDAGEMVDWLEQLVATFPIASIEDGMAEDDKEGWKLLNARLGERVQLVGDDLLVSQVEVMRRAEKEGTLPNSVLVKPNQAGTLTETLETIAFAAERGMGIVVSHRSGDTEDSFIADLATATGAGQIKTGAMSRSDRTGKYNRLLWIEHDGSMPFAAGRYLKGSMGAAAQS